MRSQMKQLPAPGNAADTLGEAKPETTPSKPKAVKMGKGAARQAQLSPEEEEERRQKRRAE